jgi:hypothetical protein
MKEVIGTVLEVLEGFKLVHLRTDDDWIYSFNKDTPGIDIDTVEKGQQYQMTVTVGRLSKVMSATLIKE